MGKQTNLAWMLAALSAAREAILRTTSRKDLYQRVCDALVEGGELVAASVYAAETDGSLRYAAGAGQRIEMFDGLEASTDATSAEAQDLTSTAFQSGTTCINNDPQNDERLRAWRRWVCRPTSALRCPYPSPGVDPLRGFFFFFWQNNARSTMWPFEQWNNWRRMSHLRWTDWDARRRRIGLPA